MKIYNMNETYSVDNDWDLIILLGDVKLIN